MLDNLRFDFHQKFIAISRPPLGLLAAPAAGQARPDLPEGVPAGLVDTLAIWRR